MMYLHVDEFRNEKLPERNITHQLKRVVFLPMDTEVTQNFEAQS